MQAYNYWQDQPGNYFVGMETAFSVRNRRLTNPTVEVLSTLFRGTASKSVFKCSYKTKKKSQCNGQRPNRSSVASFLWFFSSSLLELTTIQSGAKARMRPQAFSRETLWCKLWPDVSSSTNRKGGERFAFTDLRVFESLCLPNRVTIQTLQLPLLLDTRNEPRSKNICFWTPAAG